MTALDRRNGKRPDHLATAVASLHSVTAQIVGSVLGACKKSGWRRAIGLIAAYALALNVILTGLAAHAVPASDQTAFDPFSVICLSTPGGVHSGATDDGPSGTAPAHHAGNHCALCGFAPSAVPPFPVFLTLQFVRSAPVAIALAHRPIAGIKSLPGQPRAPPQTA